MLERKRVRYPSGLDALAKGPGGRWFGRVWIRGIGLEAFAWN